MRSRCFGVHAHLTSKVKPDGSDIDYARFYSDLSKFPDRVRVMLGEKSAELKRYRDEGLET